MNKEAKKADDEEIKEAKDARIVEARLSVEDSLRAQQFLIIK